MEPEPTLDDITYGRQVLEVELAAIRDMIDLVDERFSRAVTILLGCSGRVVTTGVGKSGLIGSKVSATLASTGTPSHFLHSGEAVHGDLGRVMTEDVVIALSYSGTTSEVIRLIPLIKKIGAPLISITGTVDNPLAEAADVALSVGSIAEACPIGLAPTSSTTAMLAMGDALAMTVAHRKDFNREEYALYHQGGSIGRKLVKVADVMRPLDEVPVVSPETTVAKAIETEARPDLVRRSGAVVVVDADGMLIGIFTDGDLKRHLRAGAEVLARPIGDLMTPNPKIAHTEELLADAFKRLKDHLIDELPVVDAAGRAAGLVDVQDVLEWSVAF
jgi:arabinose-5-phosphate isomerase